MSAGSIIKASENWNIKRRGKWKIHSFRMPPASPFMPIGLQVHNSSTGSSMIKKAVQAVKAYGGNCLEAPVYWCCVEPEQDRYDMELVKGIVDEARSAGLHLILLWFGTSKNGHPNYVPGIYQAAAADLQAGSGAG